MKLTKREGGRRGITSIEGGLVALVLIFGTMAFAYLSAVRANSAEISSLQSQIAGTTTAAGTTTTIIKPGGAINQTALPVMNQTNTIRQITETWYLSSEAHQDRFDPASIVVNQ